jgi:hypothetical protein
MNSESTFKSLQSTESGAHQRELRGGVYDKKQGQVKSWELRIEMKLISAGRQELGEQYLYRGA